MGEIIQVVADRYGATKGMYVSEVGYRVSVEPKTRTRPDAEFRFKHVTIPDYTLKQLEHAEQEYVKLVSHVSKFYSGVLNVSIAKEGSRLALVQPVHVGEVKHWSSFSGDPSGSSLFVLNLQSGLIYNVPVARLGELVKKNFAAKYSDGNAGLKVDDALEFLAEIKKASGEIFATHGFDMSDDDFAVLISLFRLRTAGIIFGDALQWVKYISAGLTIDSVKFAFDRKMWGIHGGSPVPVDQIEQFKDLPVEWARKLIIA